jgi:hypothetical protein
MTNEQIEQKALEVYPVINDCLNSDIDINGKSREGYIKAFLEVESLPKVHGWIAQDKDGLLGFYSDKPQRFDDKAWWCDPGCYTALALPPDSYPEITWESEPIEVELILRKL